MSDIGPTEEAIRALLAVPDAVKSVLLSALKAEWEEQTEKEECAHKFTARYTGGRAAEECHYCGLDYGAYLNNL